MAEERAPSPPPRPAQVACTAFIRGALYLWYQGRDPDPLTCLPSERLRCASVDGRGTSAILDLTKPTTPLGTAKEFGPCGQPSLCLHGCLSDLEAHGPPSKQYRRMLPEQPEEQGEPAGAQALPCGIPQPPWSQGRSSPLSP